MVTSATVIWMFSFICLPNILLSAHQIPGIIDVLDKYQFIRNLDSLLEADK